MRNGRAARRPRRRAASPPRAYRTAPELLGLWHRGQFLFLNPRTGVHSRVPRPLLDLLHYFREPHTVADLRADVAGLKARTARELVRRMERFSLLEAAEGPEGFALGEWPPAAALLHFSARYTQHARGSERTALEAALRRRARREPPPPPVKPRAGALRLPLPRSAPRDQLTSVLVARRTWRGFSRRPVALEQLAALLQFTWGVQGWGRMGPRDRVAFKTSPSGGARHSIEAYVMALRVGGLEPGLYHYAPDSHALELVRSGAAAAELERFLAGQSWFRPAAAAIFMTSVLPRVWWRYPHARAYRSVWMEAGHLCQTFLLLATAFGLAPFCTAALDDVALEQALGIDGVTEAALYCAGVGSRPTHGRWVQWPDRT